MSEFTKRVIIGVLGTIAIIFVLSIGGIVLDIAIFSLLLIALYEMRNAFKHINIEINYILMLIAAFIGAFDVFFYKTLHLAFYVILAVSLFDLLFLRNSIYGSSATAFSLLYLIIGFLSIILIEDEIIIGLLLIIAFGTDTFAYLVGMKFGKHKLIPDVSPKKTVEGAIGGLLGAVILSCIYLSYFNIGELFQNIILSASGSIIAQLGDFIASRIKRETGIKDFGKILPGHGGIMDRFDSVILVAPLIYWLYSGLYL